MDVKFESEYQNPPVIIKHLADLPGGLNLDASELVSDALKAGSLVGKGSDGLGHLVKTAKLHANASNTDTDYQVEKGHEFKVGDIVGRSVLTGAAREITAIDSSNDDYDVFTLDQTLGVELTASDGVILVQCETDVSSSPSLMYEPLGVTNNEAVLEYGNQGVGVMIAGVVNDEVVPYPIDDNLKALIPNVQYV